MTECFYWKKNCKISILVLYKANSLGLLGIRPNEQLCLLAYLSTNVCMEWDHHICRRCANQSRRWLVVIICVLLSVDNLLFLVTDSWHLAEEHSFILTCQHGTVSWRTWMITHLIWTILNVSLNHFCFRCT